MKPRATLSRASVVAMLATAVMLLGVFVFPLWVISLVAPQYPQGLGLHIWINRIEGAAPFDLQNINGLNHYIGMHKIEPDVIPELRYMKYFAMGLSATAALVALVRRRWALLAWVLVALVLAGVGMVDFYTWEYNYGHDLDPSAAIKVPGMTYQPPMIGTKQMLNFQATAWPGIGGLLAMLGVGIAVLAAMYEFVLRGRRLRREQRSQVRIHPAAPVVASVLLCAALATLLSFATGCAREPAAIGYGTDACEQCSMTITDERHGAVIVTTKGRSHKFDSVECMFQALMPDQKLSGVEVHSWHVVDYANRGTLIDATTAHYLVSPGVPSPMGANVSSFSAPEDAGGVQQEKGGDVMDWKAVGDYLRSWATS